MTMTHQIIMTMSISTIQNASERTERAAHAKGIYAVASWADFKKRMIDISNEHETTTDIVTYSKVGPAKIEIHFEDKSKITLIEQI